MVMMILWLACPPSPVDSDTDAPERAADVVISGSADAAAVPQALRIVDLDGDGAPDLAAGGGYRDRTCLFPGPILEDRAWNDAMCWESEAAADLSGFALTSGDLDGDGAVDLVIGAPLAAGDGYQRGRAYLVSAPDAAKVNLSTAAFTFTGTGDLDGFGISLEVMDADADGTLDLLVGAVGNDDGGPGAGQVYIFRGPLVPGSVSAADASASLIGFGPHLRHASGEPGDGVGYTMSAPGDIDGDGLGDLLLGAGGHDDPDTDAGIAALFFAPVPMGRYGLLASDIQFAGTVAGAWLGEPSAGSDDLDGDGYRELLLGSNGQEFGHVYRYDGPFLAWTPPEAAAGAWVGATARDGMGTAFLLPGDVDGDGAADALIAAPFADDSAGTVGLFLGPLPDGELTLDDADRLWTGETGDNFGRVLAAGELDGETGLDLAIGAPAISGGGTIQLFFGGAP